MNSRRAFRIAATVGPALVTLAIGVFSLLALVRLAAAREAVTRSRDIAESLHTVLARLTDAETSQRGYLLTGSREYLDPGAGAAADVHRALASARRLIADSTEQRRLDTLSTVISGKLSELESVTRAYDSRGLAAAAAVVRSDRGQNLMREARELIGTIEGAERARLEAREAYEAQLSRAKSEFLAVMSHELRTPLSAIIGYEELLFDGITGPVNEGQRTQLARIKASATHLLSLIDEVLTLSRVEGGREVAHPERVSVLAALHEASTITESLASEKQLELRVMRVPKDIEVWADSTKLRQILLNLITNAIKFTDAGSVVLESRRVDDCAEIIVRDTGIGIAPSDHDRIFDPFWQVEQKSTRKVGGTGLGLCVSRRLARLMRGDLDVESKLGAGSTFTLRLPAHRKS